ncbi:flagellar protein FlgN [Hydrogenovibrio sp. 3SP14C1]|uniref:flagella synthesis protein FlgN n=1 Tax=Hydrogenovibrio sp. 3SP14C1 TaxID=3038774 RepID=UPI002416A757|nr:flagellar protein FlgN [Hydrogenovibrio sp. 3SP14C1]MDG4812921.1 flagellar protein FlgN [Hydrogenovibrio sp. 3SP14C1]
MTQVTDTKDIPQRLDQLLEDLNTFESILDQEASVLKTSDISPLISILEQKETLSERLTQSFNWLSTNLSPDNSVRLSLKELLLVDSVQNLSEKTQRQLQHAVDLATQCYEKNIINGMTVQALKNMNQTLLNVFTGQDQNAQTYGSSGKAATSETKSNPLGKA